MKLLVVDDSATMRKIICGTLEQLGYSDIAQASDGQVALDECSKATPDLILLDWNMPNMDGLTFVKTYRGAGAKTPIIMVTTEAEKAKVVAAIKAGVNNYVVKPFTPETLEARLNDTLGKAA